MADVKSCGKCGTSIPQQQIIEGKAKLVDGRLVCASCAAKAQAAASAPPASKAAAISLPDAEEVLGSAGGNSAAEPGRKIGEGGEEPAMMQAFGAGITHGRKEVKYKRQFHVGGTGAVRVKTFDAKLMRAALELMDEQINMWLDETGCEVKFVTTTIGDLQGKTTEPHLIVNIWY